MPATAPHNYMAEQALLGAILTNNRVFGKVSEFLRAEHFADGVHGRIFAACGKLIERGQLANPVTLSSYLSQDGVLAEIGGPAYLARLVKSVLSMINVEDYGRLVLDLHRRRVIMEVGAALVEAAQEVSPDETALDVAQRAVADLETLGEDSTRGQVCGLGDAVWQVLAEAEGRARNPDRDIGLRCGLDELDDKLGGLAAPDLIIIGGRPSQGKTALATGIGYHIARAGTPVALFSLEMSKAQIGGRLLAWETGLPVLRILRGRPPDDELRRLAEASTRLAEVPLLIDDTAALTVGAIRSRARRLRRQRGIGLVVIDYLQLIGSTGRAENRVLEVAEITKSLKGMAKDLDTPVILLSQLSRQVEQREDKRPQMSDLRESGAIEQDADSILFVYREQYYLERLEPKRGASEKDGVFRDRMASWQDAMRKAAGRGEVIIAKNRQGAIGGCHLAWNGQRMQFANLSERGNHG